MRKILAILLLIILIFGNVISQAQAANQTETKPDDKQKIVTDTKRPSKSQRKKWRQRQLAKLRKENKRLRAIIARQKRLLAQKGSTNAKRNARKSTRNSSRVASKRKPGKVIPPVVVTSALTQDQINQIKSDLKQEILESLPNKPTFTKEEVEAIIKAEFGKLTAANGGVLPTPKGDGVGSTSNDSSTLGTWISEQWSSARAWVSANLYTALVVALVVLLLVIALFWWRRSGKNRTRHSSLEPSRWSKIYIWIKHLSPFGKKAEPLSVTGTGKGGLDPKEELYRDIELEANAGPVTPVVIVEQPLAPEAESVEIVDVVAAEESNEEPKASEKKVYNLKPATES